VVVECGFNGGEYLDGFGGAVFGVVDDGVFGL
jgi:hypothetical protein